MATYLLKTPARCLAPQVPTDALAHPFLVGTASLRGPNEVRAGATW
jgi:hypothetical protein